MAGIFVANLDTSTDRAAIERSVASPVDRRMIIGSFSDATYPELIEIERRGHGFYAWGVGDETGEVECWFRMQVGDWVLVGCDDHWRYCARVLGRYENLRAARSVWGDNGRAHLTLLKAYEAHCAVTNFCAPDTLEVARILPWREGKTHHPSNALLLRTDIHTLFDLGKLAIDTRSMSVVLAEELMGSSYRLIAGRPLRYPQDETMRPDPEALDMHRRLAGL